MKYKKLPISGYKNLGTYPVYIEGLYYGHEPFKIVGVRENSVELEGDYSAMNNTLGREWFNDERVFVVTTVCDEDLKPNGCQVHNVNCCGGGSRITKHVEYWNDLLLNN